MSQLLCTTPPPAYANKFGDGVLRLSWTQYVDPHFLPAGNDIYFRVEQSVNGGAFAPIDVLIPGVDQLVSDIPAVTAVAYDVANATTALRGKTVQYRIRTIRADEQSEYATGPVLTIKRDDLVAGPLVLVKDLGGGRGQYSASLRNEGYNGFWSGSPSFMVGDVYDTVFDSYQGFGFVPGRGIMTAPNSSYVFESPLVKTLLPGESLQWTQTIGVSSTVGVHPVGILVDATQYKRTDQAS